MTATAHPQSDHRKAKRMARKPRKAAKGRSGKPHADLMALSTLIELTRIMERVGVALADSVGECIDALAARGGFSIDELCTAEPLMEPLRKFKADMDGRSPKRGR